MRLISIACLALLTACASTPGTEPVEAITTLSTSASSAPRLQSYSWMSLADWYQMHAADVRMADRGESPLLFIGDSITEGWQGNGVTQWKTHFEPRGAIDFGIGGDMTQNLLWRLDNGAAGNLQPRAVVLLIGVNNTYFSSDTPEQIASGVIAVVDSLQGHFPQADILLQAVFPYGEEADSPSRDVVRRINEVLEPLGKRERVTYIDLESVFVESNGSLSADIMPDFLHLSEPGYERWAQAILPWVNERVPMPAAEDRLPHAFDAGWQGQQTCETLMETPAVRVGRCAFPAGVGHDQHYHNPHWGYVLEGSTLLIRDADGERETTTQTNGSWRTTEKTIHEALNIDDHETSYLIVEPR